MYSTWLSEEHHLPDLPPQVLLSLGDCHIFRMVSTLNIVQIVFTADRKESNHCVTAADQITS